MVRSRTGDAITDEHVERVLRRLVAGSRPLLGWVSARQAPGSPGWAAMSADQRTSWWLGRLGRLTALLAAVPGIGGALADRLPVQDALGAAGQGLLLCALAREHGLADEGDQVRLLAAVLFDRELRPHAGRAGAAEAGQEPADPELAGELARSQRRHGRFTLPAVGRVVWRMGRLLWGLGDELGKRPQGHWYHKLLGMLPVVGLVGDYLGERAALRRTARAARRWLATHQPAGLGP